MTFLQEDYAVHFENCLIFFKLMEKKVNLEMNYCQLLLHLKAQLFCNFCLISLRLYLCLRKMLFGVKMFEPIYAKN